MTETFTSPRIRVEHAAQHAVVLLDNPFLQEIDMVCPVPHPHDLEMKLLANPLRFGGRCLGQQPCRSFDGIVGSLACRANLEGSNQES